MSARDPPGLIRPNLHDNAKVCGSRVGVTLQRLGNCALNLIRIPSPPAAAAVAYRSARAATKVAAAPMQTKSVRRPVAVNARAQGRRLIGRRLVFWCFV